MNLLPKSMKVLVACDFSLEAFQFVQRPLPTVKRGEILVRVKAVSLNYRDLAILTKNYLPNLRLPFVPASDACGSIVAVGDGVTRFSVGDRVAPVYTQGWYQGLPTVEQRTRTTLGGPLDGVLQEYICVSEGDAVRAPDYLSDMEVATLPIAALTAWSTLSEGGINADSVVLVQGSGGVSLFALQFAKAAGAYVIATSSSDEKLERMGKMGADACINYRQTPDWALAVREATQGRGADIIVEVGGATLPTSLAAAALGGFVGVVGFVAGDEANIRLRSLILPMIRIQGIAIGSRARFEEMNQYMTTHQIRPVIDRVYGFDQSSSAFRHLESGSHFGKIVIAL